MWGMMGIATTTMDVKGNTNFVMLPDSKLFTTTRRITRTKTPDGGCVFSDGGFTYGDQTWEVVARYEQSLYERLQYLAQTYSLLMFMVTEGAFSGSIELVEPDDGKVRLRILVKEKLN